jgi:hypothetical protein
MASNLSIGGTFNFVLYITNPIKEKAQDESFREYVVV